MKISVVIPTYRRISLLARCLNAIARQEFPSNEFEIIVVSDGPDGSTARALHLWRQSRPYQNIRYYSTEGKKGPAAARNLGWKKAEGILIAFTDDDCLPDRDWLKQLWHAYHDSEKKEIAFSGKIKVPISAHPTDYEKNIAQMESVEFVTANCACTASALKLVDGFDERFTMAWREDSDLQFKFIMHNIPVQGVDSALVTHPVRKHCLSDYFRDEKKGLFNALLYKKWPELYHLKINQYPPNEYYFILLSLLLAVVFLLFSEPFLAATFGGLWLLLSAEFILKRLKQSSRNVGHVAEMIVSSLFIPLLSIYWQWYGSFKFKSRFIVASKSPPPQRRLRWPSTRPEW